MSVYENDINLRPYIMELIRSWWRIGLIAIIAAVAALGLSLLQPREYVASATILLTRSRVSLNLAEQFPTIREAIYDSNARTEALLSIATSDSVAFETLESIGDKLPREDKDLEDFRRKVGVSSKGDSILVSASAQNPTLAAEIANNWAHQAAVTINRAYSEDQPLADIESQISQAKQEYAEAQLNLENYIKRSRIAVLEGKIGESRNLLSEIFTNRSWQISNYYYRKQAMQNLKIQAEALKRQMQKGSRSAAGNLGDALAILNARARAFGIGQISNVRVVEQGPAEDKKSEKFAVFEDTGPNFNLQLSDLSTLVDSNAVQVEDLDDLIQQTDEEVLRIDQVLASLSPEMSPREDDELIEGIAGQLGELETQLEEEKARQNELTAARDLALEAYQVLVQKETEFRNAPQTNNQVTLASPAVPPQKPASRGTVRNTLIAGVLGGIVGIIWIFASIWWKSIEATTETEPTLSAAD